MKKHELIPNIPLTEHPLVKHYYANQFSPTEWAILSKIKLSEFCEQGFDDRLVLKVFAEIHEIANYEHVKRHFAEGKHNFQQVIDYVIKRNTNKELLSQDVIMNEERLLTGMVYLKFKKFNTKILNGVMKLTNRNIESRLDCIIKIASLFKSDNLMEEKQKLLMYYWATLAYPIIFRDFTIRPKQRMALFTFSIPALENYEKYLEMTKAQQPNLPGFDMGSLEEYRRIKKIYLSLRSFFEESKKQIELMGQEKSLLILKDQQKQLAHERKLKELQLTDKEVQLVANDQPKNNSLVFNLFGFWNQAISALTEFSLGLTNEASEQDSEEESPIVCFY